MRGAGYWKERMWANNENAILVHRWKAGARMAMG